MVEEELLVILLAPQHFEIYLPFYGPVPKIESDLHSLQFLIKFQFKNQTLTHRSLLLQRCNINVRHIRGKDKVIAWNKWA